MANYSVFILPSVLKKDFKKIPKNDLIKIMNRIQALADNPRPEWSKRLSSRPEYRIRQGNYRILYVIDDGIKVVQVAKACGCSMQ